MFEAAEPAEETGSALRDYPEAAGWDRMEHLKREKQALGCYVSGHPLRRYGDKPRRIGAAPTETLQGQAPWTATAVAGLVEDYQEKIFKGGSGKAAFFEIEDMTGRVKAKLRGDRIDTYAHLLTSGDAVLVKGKLSFPMTDEPDDKAEPTLLVDGVESLADAVKAATRSITIRLDGEKTGREQLEQVKQLLDESPGACSVELLITLEGGTEIVMGLNGTRIEPGERILSGLERVFGDVVAELR